MAYIYIEIKNSYLYEKDNIILNLKEKYTKHSGYKFSIIIEKDYSKFDKLLSLTT